MRFSDVKCSLHGLTETTVRQWAVRFAFGGLISLAVGIVGHVFGTLIAGLFLGFPSILPASLTLVKEREGRGKAAEDARGAALGGVGLVCFALIVAVLAPHEGPVLSLGAASVGWVMTSILLWRLIA